MTTFPRPGDLGELRVYTDAEQLAIAAAERFADLAAESIRARGYFRVVLSGGSTPRRVYELLATQGFRSRVDWNQVDAAALVPDTGRERRSALMATQSMQSGVVTFSRALQ
jgi:6-phosphogluconolactonase